MAVPLRMPDLGTVEGEVTLVRWLKSEGDAVALGEPLFEVETDKGVSEVEAAMAGILEKRVAAEGARVASGETIAYVRRYGESAAAAEGAGAQGPGGRVPAPAAHSVNPAPPPADRAARRIAPVLIALAAKWGVDIDSIPGTGPGGAVTRDDVLRSRDSVPAERVRPSGRASTRALPYGVPAERVLPYAAQASGASVSGAPAAGAAARGAARARPVRSLPHAQSIVAAKVSRSHREKPVYHVHALIDMSRVVAARRREGILAERVRPSGRARTAFEPSGYSRTRALPYGVPAERVLPYAGAGGQAPRFDAFFVKATAVSIAQSPVFRSFLAGDELGEHEAIDIAVALGIGDELYAPAVRNADKKSVADISREIGMLVEKAGSHSLSTQDSDDSCFLVSNLGMFPIESFEAIIYPAHAAALAVGAVTRSPVVEGEGVRVAPVVHLTLSVDHRLINGAAAARFLARVKQILENGELA